MMVVDGAATTITKKTCSAPAALSSPCMVGATLAVALVGVRSLVAYGRPGGVQSGPYGRPGGLRSPDCWCAPCGYPEQGKLM
ncbi:MAG: hypothetical protein ACJ788_03000 [Ktedonobacteraceae bacterium]